MAGARPASAPPKVSVVMPVHDRERYLGAAIESVLGQSFPDFELVIVDDGSRDRSASVARSYRDARIRLVSHARNRGVAAARNTGIAGARGAYLAFLDSDDVAFPDRLARQVAFLDRHPDHAVVGSWVDWMAEDGRPLGKVRRRPVAAADIAAQRLFRTGIQNDTGMARTAVLRRYPLDEGLPIGEDFDLWMRVAAEHKMANLPRVLVRMRAHGARITHRYADSVRVFRNRVVARHLEALGVAFAEEDLDRHTLLRRMAGEGFVPDRAYLDWIEGWFASLRANNALTRAFPEPAFGHTLGAFWLKTCWYASDGLGWRRFFASPLAAGAARGLGKEIALHLPRSLGPAPRLPRAIAPRDGCGAATR